MNNPSVARPGWPAVLVPGLVSGTLIWAAISGGSAYLTATGQEGSRATLFMTTLLAAVPLLMFAAGAAARKIADRDRPSPWNPKVPYLAGFLAGLCAGCLSAIESGMTQYLPILEPGLFPRLAFTAGRVIIYLPFVALISAFFALFALAGGYCMYVVRKRRTGQEDGQKTS